MVLFAIMFLPPGRFASYVSYFPGGTATQWMPFRTLWGIARSGSLSLGDQAPEFDLERHDRSGRVKLTSFMGVKPVVLVFGSYT